MNPYGIEPYRVDPAELARLTCGIRTASARRDRCEWCRKKRAHLRRVA